MSLPVMTRLDRLITMDCGQSNKVTQRSNTVIQSVNQSQQVFTARQVATNGEALCRDDSMNGS